VLSHDGRDASDRLLPSTLFLNLYPRSRIFGLLGHPPVRASGATEGSVVSRRAGPASAGRAATRPGCHRRVPFAGGLPLGKATWSRSVHDFASDTPSPSGSRFRLCRTACVEARRIEIAFTAPREESDYPRPEMPSFALFAAFTRRSSPAVSCDRDEVVCHELAARSAFRHSNGNDERR